MSHEGCFTFKINNFASVVVKISPVSSHISSLNNKLSASEKQHLFMHL